MRPVLPRPARYISTVPDHERQLAFLRLAVSMPVLPKSCDLSVSLKTGEWIARLREFP